MVKVSIERQYTMVWGKNKAWCYILSSVWIRKQGGENREGKTESSRVEGRKQNTLFAANNVATDARKHVPYRN